MLASDRSVRKERGAWSVERSPKRSASGDCGLPWRFLNWGVELGTRLLQDVDFSKALRSYARDPYEFR